MDRIQEALNVVYYAHSNQRDKVGGLYQYHPIRVKENLEAHPDFASLEPQEQEDARVAALLHDVIEDSPKHGLRKYKAEDLLKLGFSARSIELVELLTRKDEIPDREYYEAIRNDKLALLVKYADLADNLNHERVSKLPEKVRWQLALKYALAFEKLGSPPREWLEARKSIEIPYRHWEKSRWIYEWAES